MSTRYEYKIVPAPRRTGRSRAKDNDAKAAETLTQAVNTLAADGWQYLRADTFPFEERQALIRTHVVYHTVLIFVRAKENASRRVHADLVKQEAEQELAPPPPRVLAGRRDEAPAPVTRTPRIDPPAPTIRAERGLPDPAPPGRTMPLRGRRNERDRD